MEGSYRSGNQERGWNDPPEFLHNESSSSSSTSSTTKLTKRVSHNLTGTVKNDSANPILTPPITSPVMTQPPITPVNSVEKSGHPEIDDSNDKEKTEVSIDHIEKVLASKVQFCKENNLSNRICDDITKRIKIFSTNWPKINEKVKNEMANMATALEAAELKKANDIHIKLMMDYPSEVSQWMVGIKRLIHELTNIQSLTDALKE